MIQPLYLKSINQSLTCFILPREKFPNGLNLTYETCPDNYDNQTAKLIRYCCMNIMFDSVKHSFYKRTQDWLRYNSSTVLVVPAVLFNILSLIVLNRFQQRTNATKTSTTFYMKSLCIFDALTIISKFLNEIIVVRNGLRKHPLFVSSFLCKLLSFSEACCAITSIYLLIAMSVDKLICVLIPLKVGQLLTPKRAKYIFTCILFCSCIISSYNLLDKRSFKLNSEIEASELEPSSTTASTTTTNYNSLNETTKHFLLDDKTTLTSHISSSTAPPNSVRIIYDCDSNWPKRKNDWILVNNIIRVFLPILLLCICNSSIVYGLYRAKKKTDALFRDHNCDNRHQKNKIKLFKNKKLQSEQAQALENLIKQPQNNQQIHSQQQNTNMHIRGRNNTQHISIMLFAVSFGFVVFNLPFAIRTLFHRQFQENFKMLDYLYQEDIFTTHTSKNEINSAIKYEFFTSLTHLLTDLNYIANFFLYFFSGTKFRAQLYKMLACCKKKDKRNLNNNFNNTNTNNYLNNYITNTKISTQDLRTYARPSAFTNSNLNIAATNYNSNNNTQNQAKFTLKKNNKTMGRKKKQSNNIQSNDTASYSSKHHLKQITLPDETSSRVKNLELNKINQISLAKCDSIDDDDEDFQSLVNNCSINSNKKSVLSLSKSVDFIDNVESTDL